MHITPTHHCLFAENEITLLHRITGTSAPDQTTRPPCLRLHTHYSAAQKHLRDLAMLNPVTIRICSFFRQCCLTRTRTQTDRTRICSATITPLGNSLSKIAAKVLQLSELCKLFPKKIYRHAISHSPKTATLAFPAAIHLPVVIR